MIIVNDLTPISGQSTALKSKASKKIKSIISDGIQKIEKNTKGRGLVIPQSTLEISQNHVNSPVASTIDLLIRIQEKVATRQYETIRPCTLEPTAGIKIKQEVRAVDSMAVVVNGEYGTEIPEIMASLLISARVAGVSQRIVLLKPDINGGISPISLYAAYLSDATHVFRTGGAEGIVALSQGWLCDIPEKIFLPEGNRMEMAIYSALLKKPWKEAIDLLVFTDSKAGVKPVINILASWIQDNPFGRVALVTTSKRVLNRIESHLDKIKDSDPTWERELKNVQVVIVSSIEAGIELISKYQIDYLVPLISNIDEVFQLNSVNHFVIGDIISPLISKRILNTGIVDHQISINNQNRGIFNFLKTVTIEKIDNKAGERLKIALKQLGRLQLK